MSIAPCLTCGKPSPGGYCKAHQPEESDHVKRHRREKQHDHGRDTRAWRRLRGLALWKAGRRCQFGLGGCTGDATSVHLDPALGGDHSKATLRHLTACCAHCHGVIDGPRHHEVVAAAKTIEREGEVLVA